MENNTRKHRKIGKLSTIKRNRFENPSLVRNSSRKSLKKKQQRAPKERAQGISDDHEETVFSPVWPMFYGRRQGPGRVPEQFEGYKKASLVYIVISLKSES